MKFSRLFILILIAVSTLAACRQGQETPPVPREKMGRILLDMQLAEAYSQGLGDSTISRFDKNQDSLTGFYTSILKHYKMSFPEFKEALEWYKERPLLLDSLYNKVLTQLIEIKAQRGITDSEEPPVKKENTKVNTTDTLPVKSDRIMKKDIKADSSLRKDGKRDSAHKKETNQPAK